MPRFPGRSMIWLPSVLDTTISVGTNVVLDVLTILTDDDLLQGATIARSIVNMQAAPNARAQSPASLKWGLHVAPRITGTGPTVHPSPGTGVIDWYGWGVVSVRASLGAAAADDLYDPQNVERDLGAARKLPEGYTAFMVFEATGDAISVRGGIRTLVALG